MARGSSGPVPFWDRLSFEGRAETTLAAALDGDAQKQRTQKQCQVSACPIAESAIQSQRCSERMVPIFIDHRAGTAYARSATTAQLDRPGMPWSRLPDFASLSSATCK